MILEDGSSTIDVSEQTFRVGKDENCLSVGVTVNEFGVLIEGKLGILRLSHEEAWSLRDLLGRTLEPG